LLITSKGDTYSHTSSLTLNETFKGPHRLVVYDEEKQGTDMLLGYSLVDDEIFTWFSYFLI
jgi:hypothetical protein